MYIAKTAKIRIVGVACQSCGVWRLISRTAKVVRPRETEGAFLPRVVHEDYHGDSAASNRKGDLSAWIGHVEEQARTGGECREVRH